MTNHMKPSNKVLADRLKRDEWGQKMYRPNGGEFITSHKHGVVGEAYDEMLDGLNYLYRAQSERALDARSLVHLAADLLAAEIMELEALGTTIDERNRMELTADTETGKDQRIAALKAQLAEANERCAGLAAALEARGPCKNCDGKGTVWYRKEYADGSFGGALHKLCRCGGIDPSAILAAVREKARREGAVEALKRFRTWERVIYGAGSCHAEIRTEIDERIAALEAQG